MRLANMRVFSLLQLKVEYEKAKAEYEKSGGGAASPKKAAAKKKVRRSHSLHLQFQHITYSFGT